jgi:hypothetical protein
VLTVFSIKVTSYTAGAHYAAPAALLSAEAVALLVHDFLKKKDDYAPSKRNLLVALGCAVLLLPIAATARRRPRMGSVDIAAWTVRDTGLELKKLAHPGDLVVVRARLYDPRIFYICHLRGWQLNFLVDDPAPIADHVKHGARYFVDPQPDPQFKRVHDWLEHHARRIDSGATMNPPRETGQIWDLRAAAAAL